MSLLEEILEWAKKQEIQFQKEEESILFSVNGDNGSWYARVTALEEDDMIFIVTAYPFQVAEVAREKTAVALGKITSQLKMGALYIDVEDGQINFRISQKVSTDERRDAWIEEFIMLAMRATDTYYRKMMSFAAEE